MGAYNTVDMTPRFTGAKSTYVSACWIAVKWESNSIMGRRYGPKYREYLSYVNCNVPQQQSVWSFYFFRVNVALANEVPYDFQRRSCIYVICWTNEKLEWRFDL